MVEYDLPLNIECDVCFGNGFLWVTDPTTIGLSNGSHRGKVTCEKCEGRCGLDLPELELETF